MNVPPPLALLAELTHRCPMRCLYCSNPLALEPASRELDTVTWRRVLDEAADLGVLQVHFSGGEPLARRDLEDLVSHAARIGLYTNLITSGIGLSEGRVEALAVAGLDHVQLSFQDDRAEEGERIGGFAGAFRRKVTAAGWIRARGLALTVNLVIQRANTHRVAPMIDMAVDLGARRIEVAHVQYYGWALANRDVLLPSRAQLEETSAAVAAARARLKGTVTIDYVIPDYHARLPKACMGGWGRRFLNVDPAGRVLPCHAATTIPGLPFESVHDRDLAGIWSSSEAFNRFRGTAWMPEPCAGCERREEDWGGCRCQALALAGDAARTDPVCERSPDHGLVQALAEAAAAADSPIVYRGTRDASAPATAVGGG